MRERELKKECFESIDAAREMNQMQRGREAETKQRGREAESN